MGLPGLEQLNITLNRAEQRLVVHVPQVPVIRDFQSVLLSSNWHEVWPPLETLVQGCWVPGNLATAHPNGIGTWQLRDVSPFSIPKLHTDSVVAVPPIGWVDAGLARSRPKTGAARTGTNHTDARIIADDLLMNREPERLIVPQSVSLQRPYAQRKMEGEGNGQRGHAERREPPLFTGL